LEPLPSLAADCPKVANALNSSQRDFFAFHSDRARTKAVGAEKEKIKTEALLQVLKNLDDPDGTDPQRRSKGELLDTRVVPHRLGGLTLGLWVLLGGHF
jgi:hypothetical protein